MSTVTSLLRAWGLLIRDLSEVLPQGGVGELHAGQLF